MSTQKIKGGLMIAALVIISACASKPQHEASVSPKEDPVTQINRANDEVIGLRNENASILAPKEFDHAQSSLEKAKSLQISRSSDERILKQAALSLAWSADAKEKIEHNEPALKTVLENRKFADTAQAPRLFPHRWKGADQDLQDLAAESGMKNKEKWAKNVDEMNRRYLALEGDAVATANLKSARKNIEQAEENKAAKFAPQTLKEANLEYERSWKAIQGSPRNREVIQTSADRANEKADLLKEVTNEAIVNGAIGSEMIIRKNIEDRLQTENDLRARDQQIRTLAGQKNQVQGERMKAEQKAAILEADLQSKDAEEQTRAKHDIQAKAKEIRQMFNPSEADVYVDGNTVLIRLKALQFAVNQAILTPQHYPLLGKVMDAIDLFDNEKITIEGHTDSTGVAARNQDLSQKRAEAVQAYLLANEDLETSQIEAVGYGYEKPIATNKTAQGRAQNRRIDIKIETQTQP